MKTQTVRPIIEVTVSSGATTILHSWEEAWAWTLTHYPARAKFLKWGSANA